MGKEMGLGLDFAGVREQVETQYGILIMYSVDCRIMKMYSSSSCAKNTDFKS